MCYRQTLVGEREKNKEEEWNKKKGNIVLFASAVKHRVMGRMMVFRPRKTIGAHNGKRILYYTIIYIYIILYRREWAARDEENFGRDSRVEW